MVMRVRQEEKLKKYFTAPRTKGAEDKKARRTQRKKTKKNT